MKKFNFTAVATGTAVAVIAVSLLTAGARPEAQSLAPEALVPRLGDVQVSTDKLPEGGANGIVSDAGLVEDTSRYLGSSADADLWVVLDAQGNVCILTTVSESDGEATSAANCMPRQHFYGNGASIRVEDAAGEGVVAHLLPPGLEDEQLTSQLVGVGDMGRVSSPGLDAQGIEVIGDQQVLVMNLEVADSIGTLEISRPDQTELVLPDLN